ncbi:MAG: nitronate monooxygenase [Bdellovibrionales bacterium]|nr:nitronate monooxygenase [Bdellovibrionales bacterium]
MMNCNLPIIGAPMFLVSNEDLVVKVSEKGGVGTTPSLNWRPPDQFEKALKNIKSQTQKPIGVNIIVNQSNPRQKIDLKISLDVGVDLFITSLGNPKEVIKQAHQNGAKVICDVTNLEHALKVQDLGADGVIAVSSGAGGHAGPISPFALIPWLKRELNIPIVAAGAIADGYSMAAAFALGASAVSIGTRLIASKEAQVDTAYKQAIVKSTPEDIILTKRISGTPAAVIRTPYIEKMGTELPFLLEQFKKIPQAKKIVQMFIYSLGSRSLERSAKGLSWKEVWSAGQSVGAINEVLPTEDIIDKLMNEYFMAVKSLPLKENLT